MCLLLGPQAYTSLVALRLTGVLRGSVNVDAFPLRGSRVDSMVSGGVPMLVPTLAMLMPTPGPSHDHGTTTSRPRHNHGMPRKRVAAKLSRTCVSGPLFPGCGHPMRALAILCACGT